MRGGINAWPRNGDQSSQLIIDVIRCVTSLEAIKCKSDGGKQILLAWLSAGGVCGYEVPHGGDALLRWEKDSRARNRHCSCCNRSIATFLLHIFGR